MTPHRAARGHGEAGVVGGVEILPLALLVFTAGMLLVMNGWAIVDARLAVAGAAREAVRTAVEAPDAGTAFVSGEAAARRELAGSGRAADRLTVTWSSAAAASGAGGLRSLPAPGGDGELHGAGARRAVDRWLRSRLRRVRDGQRARRPAARRRPGGGVWRLTLERRSDSDAGDSGAARSCSIPAGFLALLVLAALAVDQARVLGARRELLDLSASIAADAARVDRPRRLPHRRASW